jgi:hypothetical protein
MSSEVITTVASAWMLWVVAGVGVVSLPWTAVELAESAAAYRQLWGWVRGFVSPRGAAVIAPSA